MRRNIVVMTVVGALAAAVWGCGGADRGSSPPDAATGQVPELLPVTGHGLLERVRSSAAEVVLVNVWATWCLPCREEFPALLRLTREFSHETLDLVLVSADFPDQAEAARTFLAEHHVTFPTYLKREGDQEFIDAVSERWSGALPATLVFNRQRELVRFWEGGASFEEFRAAVDAAAGRSMGEE